MKRVIIKIGSQSLINNELEIDYQRIDKLMSIISNLMKKEVEVLLVTSGAIAIGIKRMGLKEKPKQIALKQACAATGQVALMQTYEDILKKYDFLCAQILVSHDDFESRERVNNLSNTIEALFNHQILPIVNENDALATQEIKVGDNDTLSALLVPMIKANHLILVSDIDGLYDKNPKEFDDANLIEEVIAIDENIESLAGTKKTNMGTGGMSTKLKAARIACNSGADMFICNANNLENITKICLNEEGIIGTHFLKAKNILSSKVHWLIFKTYSKGIIYVDEGCCEAIIKHKSLLAKGIVKVDGEFFKDSVVLIKYGDEVIAKGISNYSSDEINKIKGHNSQEFNNILNKITKDEVIHANDLVVLSGVNYGHIR